MPVTAAFSYTTSISLGPYSSSKIQLTRDCSPVQVLIPLWYLVVWPSWPISQQLPAPKNNEHQERWSEGIRNTYYDRLNLFKFRVCLIRLFLRRNDQCLTSESIQKFSDHTWAIGWSRRDSNTAYSRQKLAYVCFLPYLFSVKHLG